MGCSTSSPSPKKRSNIPKPKCRRVSIMKEDKNVKVQTVEDILMEAIASVVENEYKPGSSFLESTEPTNPASENCIYGYNHSKWPIRNYIPVEFNVNAHHGGLAALVQISCDYGGGNTSQLFLLRAGFDSNFMEATSLGQSHKGHFGPATSFQVEESGRLLANCLFGGNHLALMSNSPCHGNLGHGLTVHGGTTAEEPVVLPVRMVPKVDFGGAVLALCSGYDAGGKLMSAVYLLRPSSKEDGDKLVNSTLVHGDDTWTWNLGENSLLTGSGVAGTTFGLYHNRPDKVDTDAVPAGESLAGHAQAANGTTLLLTQPDQSGLLLVMCSTSSGQGNSTAAALYQVALSAGSIHSMYIGGSIGGTYSGKSADLWKFHTDGGKLIAVGPAAPCRYGYVSNLKKTSQQEARLCCLVTGEESPLEGAVEVDHEGVRGWVNKTCNIIAYVNELPTYKMEAESLVDAGNSRKAFGFSWRPEDSTPGLHLVKVCAQWKNTSSGEVVDVELHGSPFPMAVQPSGVLFAINCAAPMYQAHNDIVYENEHKHYANFDPDYVFGTQSRARGVTKASEQIPQLIPGCIDGQLYATYRTTGAEAVDLQNILYEIDDMPNKKLILRLHFLNRSAVGNTSINGKEVSFEILELMTSSGSQYVDIPVRPSDGKITLAKANGNICAFVVFDPTVYKEKTKTETEMKADLDQKQKLADQSEPLPRTMTLKARTLVGWSQNLLNNASGEAGDMSYWNTSGDIQVHDGGYGTEKAFVTSHMWCSKYQEVDLTEYFTPEYLDTAPEIQISEWYREGVGGGGFYRFKAGILKEDGTEVDTVQHEETERIYRNNEWREQKAVFINYGPGVRRAYLESAGKDDKYWAGHYGVIMSNCVIRAKREAKPADNDKFEDVLEEEDQKAKAGTREKLATHLLKENQDLIAELEKETVVPEVDGTFYRQTEVERPRGARKRQKKREIRVFVSSTFRDFKTEREHLIKKTFREINGLCAERGVFFTYVDLRWGITEDQTTNGQTIAICLQEIERCRPYFICMMGERFGWSQQEDKPDKLLSGSFDYAIDNHPNLRWLERYRYGTSVTQLEILHGVLNDVDDRKHRAFFYLRELLDQNGMSALEVKQMKSESEWHLAKQLALRKCVESEPSLKVHQYRDAEEVCDLIKQDLEWCVDQDFPRGTELTALEREHEAHQAFSEARRRIYIGREDYFTNIDDAMAGDIQTPLVILGESGSGKSALVANWVGRVEEREPETFLFVHFIGSSAESASYTKMLRRLFEEIRLHLRLDLSVPSSDTNLIRDLPLWLKMAGAQGKCLLVFDALNQLDDGSGSEGSEHDLLWIPRELPPGVKMLLSTLPGRAHDAVVNAGWPTLQVTPLQPSEKMEIVTGYLEGIYGKTLSMEQKSMMVDAPQTNNALYLKALLDEVRMYGSFRLLTEKIKDYLTAGNPGDLFAKILERLEEDFEKEHKESHGLVKNTTTAIWCSHKGMSEAELLDILQVPSAIWSPFYLSLVENIVNRNGIVNFFHDHLRQAVESKYLPTDADKKKGYKKLAAFFSSRDVDDRVAEELPYLLQKAGDLKKLQKTVSNLDIFQRLAKSEDGKFELIKAWKLLGDFSQVEDAYMEELGKVPPEELSTDGNLNLQKMLAEFFVDLGLYNTGRKIFEQLLHQTEKKYGSSHYTLVYDAYNVTRKVVCNHDDVIDLLHNLGEVCGKNKNLDDALIFYKDSISRITRLNTPKQKLQLTSGLLGQATILYLMDDMNEAKKFLLRARELATDVLGSRHHFVAAIINKLGQLGYTQGRLEEALGYFIQDLKLTRGEVGMGHPRTAAVLNNIALVYDDQSKPLAGELYEVALSILRDTYGNNHVDVAVIRYNMGAYYLATSSFKRARYQLEEAVQIYKTFLGPDHEDTKEAISTLNDIKGMLK